MRTAAFTILAPNYRHFARVLMESVERHHPEWDRFALIVGGPADGTTEERFAAVSLDALPLPHRRRFCFRYTLLELNTAVKPWMGAHLFAQGYDRVIYFDPDIVVTSPLLELDAEKAFITLTPHLTGFIGGDETHPSERTILQSGTNNLGFLAMTRQSPLDDFLGWWQDKLEDQCIVDPARGLFVDQKWIDLVPGLFPGVRILRHDGYNVAYWNLAQRDVIARDGAYFANDQPLRFFHFSGFDPLSTGWLSRHARRDLTGSPAVARLAADYAAALRHAESAAFRDVPYAFGSFADGTRIPDAARHAYRESPELQEAAGDDPFAHPELFRTFRDPSRSAVAANVALHSYRVLSRARPLVALLPRRARVRMRELLLGRPDPKAAPPRGGATLPPGLNIAGYFSRDTGVGESARRCAASCDAVSLPHHRIDVDDPNALARQAIHRATVFHVNADQTLAVHARMRRLFDDSAYRIGVWHWELPELPDAWIGAAAPLDEIWAPTAFIQSTVSRKVSIPVVHMPHGIHVASIESCPPQELGVPPGRFTFLCMFDLASVMERKNPRGAVEAFRRAFRDDPTVALLLKCGSTDPHADDYASLAASLRGIPNVFLTDRMLTRARVNGLIAGCDAVLSLHRSEGFGLILAEAMALGKPVIATGWSGNMDFMNDRNSCPVGYELVTIDRPHRSYEAGQQWADPDLDHAAKSMRRIVEDAAWRSAIAARGRATIHTSFSPEAAGLRYRQRLAFLGLLDREQLAL